MLKLLDARWCRIFLITLSRVSKGGATVFKGGGQPTIFLPLTFVKSPAPKVAPPLRASKRISERSGTAIDDTLHIKYYRLYPADLSSINRSVITARYYGHITSQARSCDKYWERLEISYIPLVGYASKITKTRSQAVARIADRTAKNCRGHVT